MEEQGGLRKRPENEISDNLDFIVRNIVYPDSSDSEEQEVNLKNLSKRLEWGKKKGSDPIHGYNQAIQAYEEALKIDPDFAEAWNNKGYVLFSLQKYEEAIAAYDRALMIDPMFVEARYNKANALYKLKKFEQAIQVYDQVLKIRPLSAKAWNNKGNSLASLRRFDESIMAYEQALKINPKLTEAWYNKANVLFIREKVSR